MVNKYLETQINKYPINAIRFDDIPSLDILSLLKSKEDVIKIKDIINNGYTTKLPKELCIVDLSPAHIKKPIVETTDVNLSTFILNSPYPLVLNDKQNIYTFYYAHENHELNVLVSFYNSYSSLIYNVSYIRLDENQGDFLVDFQKEIQGTYHKEDSLLERLELAFLFLLYLPYTYKDIGVYKHIGSEVYE